MRINKLLIKKYKNLNAEMEHHNGIIGFIGNNGSGKSNILEALSYLFRSLYEPKHKIDFEYDLVYTTSTGSKVRFLKNGTKVQAFVNNEPIIDYSPHLPKKVIAIYSGEEGRMFEDCYFPFYEEFIRQLNNAHSEYSELPKMLYLNKFYWNISLLTLLLSDAPDSKEFAEKVLKISVVNKIKFDLNKSNYTHYKANQALAFINAIDSKSEYRLEELKEALDLLYSVDDVYKYLYLAYTPKTNKILSDITILFNGNLTLKELSEGQKKLLLIKAALEFAGQEDTLFIMDEPDAHIHINNKEQITNSFIPYKHNRQIIITTHSPTVTRCMDDDELYMLSSGKIEPKERQEIMEDITGEFWNKHQQSTFLAAKKPIVILVEGVHDKAHLQHAYVKLEKEFKGLSFDIFSLGGESKIAPFMRGLYEGGLTDGKMYIAIYDNDNAGTGALSKDGFMPIENEVYRKLKDDKGVNYFAFCYPKPNGLTHECTIENLFPLTKYQEAYKQAFEDEDGFTTNSKPVSKIAENITENAKRNLSLKSKEFDIADFEHFKPVFALISKISKGGNAIPNLQNARANSQVSQPAQKSYTEIYTNRRNTDVRAEFYSETKVVIKAGSKLSKDVVSSYDNRSARNRELKKIADETDKHWVLKQDKEFNSVSGAINYTTGGSMNGWQNWLLKFNNKPLQSIRIEQHTSE
jgi:predicted ATP-dependent endonuclease of OLD family